MRLENIRIRHVFHSFLLLATCITLVKIRSSGTSSLQLHSFQSNERSTILEQKVQVDTLADSCRLLDRYVKPGKGLETWLSEQMTIMMNSLDGLNVIWWVSHETHHQLGRSGSLLTDLPLSVSLIPVDGLEAKHVSEELILHSPGWKCSKSQDVQETISCINNEVPNVHANMHIHFGETPSLGKCFFYGRAISCPNSMPSHDACLRAVPSKHLIVPSHDRRLVQTELDLWSIFARQCGYVSFADDPRCRRILAPKPDQLQAILRCPARPNPMEKIGWSIGIMTGSSIFDLHDPFVNCESAGCNPVVSRFNAPMINGYRTFYVADPFLIRRENQLHMFFEALVEDPTYHNSARGVICHAHEVKGSSGLEWRFTGQVLHDTRHASFPFVFESEDEVYMMPETSKDKQLRLYRATEFPIRWELDTVLIERPLVDSSAILYNGTWYIFAMDDDRRLIIYFADKLRGPYSLHPANPVCSLGGNHERPGGRIHAIDGKLYRISQTQIDRYGEYISIIEITMLNKSSYSEKLIAERAQPTHDRKPSPQEHWNTFSHHLDGVKIEGTNEWVFVVDGDDRKRQCSDDKWWDPLSCW